MITPAPAPEDAYSRFVIEDTPDLVTVLSPVGTIEYESPSIFRVLGYTPGELLGKNAFRLIHPADWARGSAAFARGLLSPGVPISVEFRVRHKDGSWKILECVGKYVKSEKDGGHVILNSRDISERREADEILRRSEANLAAAQRIAHLGSWELDLSPDGKPENSRLRWSAEAYRIFGYQPGTVSVTLELFYSHVHPEDRERIRDALSSTLYEGTPYRIEHRIRRAGGEEGFLLEQAEVTYDAHGRPLRMMGTVLDITEAHEAGQTRAMLAALFESSTDALIVRSLDGKIIRWNPAAARAFGYEASEALGQTLSFLTLPDQVNDVMTIFEKAKEGFSVPTLETVRRHKDGHTIYVSLTLSPIRETSGRIVAIASIVRDMSERKKAEKELQESEMRFRQMAESIQEVFWLSDLEKKQMLYVSPSYEKVWGRTVESLYETPTSFLEAIHPEDRPKVIDALGRQATGDYDIEYRIQQPNGTIRWIHDRAFPIRNTDGRVYRMAGIAQDITESNRMERMLVQSEKMSAVGQLAAGVAHEINNPLGVILGFAQSLLKRVKDSDPFYRPVQSIEREALRCKRLVQELLTFSRDRKSGMAPELPDGILEGALALIETQAKVRRIEVRRILEEGLPAVEADRHQLQQVLINLCTNAMDAMPDGGTLIIGMRRQGAWLEIRVEDTGIGITPEAQSHIFEPFYTTKEIGKGTGLGLSLVYEIVKNHHGEVEFKSLPNQGTTFWVRLPFLAATVSSTPVAH